MLKRKKTKFLRNNLAQSASELAIFGGILVFILGAIVRQAINANFQQNTSLKAVRLAMLESAKAADGWYSPPLASYAGLPGSSRNSAAVVFVEDRTAPSIGKYGPVSRTPFVASGTATHSAQLFQPITDPLSEDYNLPRIDMFVNGQHFIFTTAAFRRIQNFKDPTHRDWNPQCAYALVYNGMLDLTYVNWLGCRRLYRQVMNFSQDPNSKWCYQDCGAGGCCDFENRPNRNVNMNANQRFDLDRDPATSRGTLAQGYPPGTEVCRDPPCSVPQNRVRSTFAWQWYLIQGFGQRDGPHTARLGYTTICGPFVADYKVNFGDTVILLEDVNSRRNVDADVDGDMKEELLLRAEPWDGGMRAVPNEVWVLDYQEGDLDFTFDGDPNDRPGLQDDVMMFSETTTKDGGTRLILEEGQMDVGAGVKQYIKSTQRRDRIDLISRAIKLSNNTNRFCDAGGNPQPMVDGMPNPVEVCRQGVVGNNCFDNGFQDRTCYDLATDTIHVRSRLRDRGGIKWITEVK